MHNLSKFFKKYFSFFFFLFLQAICAWLIYTNNQFQKASIINSANQVSGKVFSVFDNVGSYLNLKSSNDSLAAQNARWMEHAENSKSWLVNDSVTVVDTIYRNQYVYTSAKVLNNTVHRPANFLTLNKGSNNGIEKGMGVIGAHGIVGIVKEVSPNFSTVISILNRNIKVSVKLLQQENIGSLEWQILDPSKANVVDIPKHVQISKGDPFVTSGYSSIFPEGIVIGKVSEFEVTAGNNFYNIRIDLIEDYTKLQYVYVVKNLM